MISYRHSNRDTERNKEIAFLEAQVYEYVEILGVSLNMLMVLLGFMFRASFMRKPHVDILRMWLQEQRQLTHENVQRKQARTGEEREEEEEEQVSESESEDEDNEIIYNPKNLPLGWDGKVRLQTHLQQSNLTGLSNTHVCLKSACVNVGVGVHPHTRLSLCCCYTDRSLRGHALALMSLRHSACYC